MIGRRSLCFASYSTFGQRSIRIFFWLYSHSLLRPFVQVDGRRVCVWRGLERKPRTPDTLPRNRGSHLRPTTSWNRNHFLPFSSVTNKSSQVKIDDFIPLKHQLNDVCAVDRHWRDYIDKELQFSARIQMNIKIMVKLIEFWYDATELG